MRVIRTIPSRCSHDRCFPDLSIRRARSARRGAERGMVTVELAVSILSAALMAVAIARQLARGDEAAAERARASVPPGSEVLTDVDDGVVRVSVTDELRWGRLGPVRVSGRATVTEEPHAREQRP